MSVYFSTPSGKRDLKRAYLNIGSGKKEIKSMWASKNGVVTKIWEKLLSDRLLLTWNSFPYIKKYRQLDTILNVDFSSNSPYEFNSKSVGGNCVRLDSKGTMLYSIKNYADYNRVYIYESKDGGSTWDFLYKTASDGMGLRKVGNLVYCDGTKYSEDNGRTWNQLYQTGSTSYESMKSSLERKASSNYIAVADNYLCYSSSGTYYYRINKRFGDRYSPKDIAVKDDTIVVSLGYGRVLVQNNPQTIESSDSWVEISVVPGLTGYVAYDSIACIDGVFYLFTEENSASCLYASTNGTTWTKVGPVTFDGNTEEHSRLMGMFEKITFKNTTKFIAYSKDDSFNGFYISNDMSNWQFTPSESLIDSSSKLNGICVSPEE